MTTSEIHAWLKTRFGEKINDLQVEETRNPTLVVEPSDFLEVMQVLKEKEELAFDMLMDLAGLDRATEAPLEVIYHLFSMTHRHSFTVRVLADREGGEIPSVSQLWHTADWHEREVYDMYGVRFSGHPDLKRILLEEDWEGFPLKKDYVAAETYRGMKIAKEVS